MAKVFSLIVIFSSIIFAQADLDIKYSLQLDNTYEQEYESNFTTAPVREKKKAGLAIIYSLLLPGMGELYAESYETGKYFTVAEGALWMVLLGMDYYAGWQKDNYMNYAVSFGNVNNTGDKSEDYYADIGNYRNIDQYNDDMARKRRFEDMYNPATHYWRWEANNYREEYRSSWLSSESAYNNIRFVAAAMLLNRLASVINAVRLVASYNDSIEETAWNVYVGTGLEPNYEPKLTFNFRTNF